MGSSLAAALQAGGRLVELAGARGALLVSQDLCVAVAALVHTSSSAQRPDCHQRGGSNDGNAASSKNSGGAGGADGGGSSTTSIVTGLLSCVTATLAQHTAPVPAQLLPHRQIMYQSAGGCSGDHGAVSGGMASREDSPPLRDVDVLLLCASELLAWEASAGYNRLIKDAQPLHRLLSPACGRQ